jgi:AcrR family transcriptional regulator
MMARIIKEHERTVKRNEIIDAAQRFIYTKGYEQMTIQDILDELQISKGAFYHYFDSKGALLEALIDRMRQEAEVVILPVTRDPRLNALEKLQRVFDASARWKTERKDYLLSLLHVWYADDNAIVRYKVQNSLIQQSKSMLTEIVRQGVQEGTFNTPFPDQVGEIAFYMLLNLGEDFVRLLFSPGLKGEDLGRIQCTVDAYTDALERVLGAPAGSLSLMDHETVKEWVDLLERSNEHETLSTPGMA